jgi:hypothetical protein
MNEEIIKKAFHKKHLSRHHKAPSTIVIDELGLHHGRYRADIAVVNGNLVGYEIKSDVDSLRRLDKQVSGYNSVFDRVHLIATNKHLPEARAIIPKWWGIILVTEGPRGGIKFTRIQQARKNPVVDDYAVAKLLWRNEAVQILIEHGLEEKDLEGRRSYLYGHVVKRLTSTQLRLAVGQHLMARSDWRSY